MRKRTRNNVEEEIRMFREEADEAKQSNDFETFFLRMDRIAQLEEFLLISVDIPS